MIAFDVNVFVYALDPTSSHHEEARHILQSRLGGSETVAVLDSTLVSTCRITTHRRLMANPLSPDQALEFCTAVRSAPAALSAPALPAAWEHFQNLVTRLGLRGGDLSDAWLAAQALALGARFVTFDRGFRRFSQLDVVVLGEGGAQAR